MKTIVLNLDDPAATVQMLRHDADGRRRNDNDLALLADAIAIEAAKDRKVIVLDVEELGPDIDWLRKAAAHLAPYSARGATFLASTADALDSLPPPRPPEPTGYGALVRQCTTGLLWLRVNTNDGAVWRIDDSVTASSHWENISGPIEVLSEGVKPERGKITVVDDGRNIDVSSPGWEPCRTYGPTPWCPHHIDHTYVKGQRYGRKAAGA
jgi:hypothetical protein